MLTGAVRLIGDNCTGYWQVIRKTSNYTVRWKTVCSRLGA